MTEAGFHTAVVIPALEPDQKLVTLALRLQALELHRIIVVNDGSSTQAEPVFRMLTEAGVCVIRHPNNLGKGAALRTGIEAAYETYGRLCSVITADADGQHLPEDILKVAETMQTHPESLVLGVRSFSGKDVPFRSRSGNRITSLFFRLSTGNTCSDTQTGLRGIPAHLIPLARAAEGDRYDYEMQFLMEAVRRAELIQIPIHTIYEDGNQCSHFRPVRDSLLIYRKPLRFLAASLTGAGVDFALFLLLCSLLGTQFGTPAAAVLAASISARCVSGILNFLLNKYWSFQSRAPAGKEAVRYVILFFLQMHASAFGTAALSAILPAPAAKLIIDCTLFVFSYLIQKRWVFQKGVDRNVQKAPVH